MAVNRTPVLKRCRSLGMDPIYLGIDKKSNRQSKRANKKMSEYGLQLREKQKAKFIYGVLEKPFRNYFAKASKMNGLAGNNLMILLESRLDNLVYRMSLARTRRLARQLVNHGHILVDGHKVDIPSYLVKPGQVITVKESSQKIAPITESVELVGTIIPAYVTFNKETLTGTYVRYPERKELAADIHEELVVEFYNKMS